MPLLHKRGLRSLLPAAPCLGTAEADMWMSSATLHLWTCLCCREVQAHAPAGGSATPGGQHHTLLPGCGQWRCGHRCCGWGHSLGTGAPSAGECWARQSLHEVRTRHAGAGCCELSYELGASCSSRPTWCLLQVLQRGVPGGQGSTHTLLCATHSDTQMLSSPYRRCVNALHGIYCTGMSEVAAHLHLANLY